MEQPPLAFSEHEWIALGRCGDGHGGRQGKLLKGWAPFAAPFQEGEVVALELKSNVRHCHARVLGDVLGEEAEQHAGLHPVQLLNSKNGTTVVHVDPKKMARVLPQSRRRVLVVADTINMRRLAKTQVGQEDAVLEIGSAFGECTRILACHAKTVVGVDLAKEMVEASRKRLPELRFEWLDFFEEPGRIRALWAEMASAGALKLFVDVGGDRAACDVCTVLRALSELAEDPQLSPPELVVVKSRELAILAETVACDAEGRLLDPASWWTLAAAPSGRPSSQQEKKKHNRARRAMWSLQGDGEGAPPATLAAMQKPPLGSCQVMYRAGRNVAVKLLGPCARGAAVRLLGGFD